MSPDRRARRKSWYSGPPRTNEKSYGSAAGAVIGVILAFFIVTWALILLSSVFGAYLVVHALHVGGFLESIIFIALVMGGILFQSRSGKPKAQPQQ